MAHGITLLMRYTKRPEPGVYVSVEYDAKGRRISMPTTFINPKKDRSLAGKKRIKARKAARR